MPTRIKVDMRSIEQIIKAKGLDGNGEVQRYVTNIINLRITRYMPYRAGVLSTKLKRVISPTEILVEGPYAQFQYYGKVMVGIYSGSPWAQKDEPKRETNRDLVYDKYNNPLAGPKWDVRLMAAEGNAIRQLVQTYIDRRAGK